MKAVGTSAGGLRHSSRRDQDCIFVACLKKQSKYAIFKVTWHTVYQSSPHPSSLVFFCGADDVFFIALVPMLSPGLGAPPEGAPKLSQKSFRSGSTFRDAAAALALSSWPSTNLLNDSAAPLAPVWIP